MEEDGKYVFDINKTIGKRYNLEVITGTGKLNYLSMGTYYLKQSKLKRYENVKLIEVNGLVIGQMHFITEDEEYLMVPWCYIISMIPSESETKKEIS